MRALVLGLQRGLPGIACRVEEVAWVRPAEHLLLQQAQVVIQQLLAKAKRQTEEDPQYAEVLARLAGQEEVEAAEAAGEVTEGAAPLPDIVSGKKKRPKPRRGRG
jgi:hypothetical protein